MSRTSYPCTQCGADLAYTPGTQSMRCEYCGHVAEFAAERAPHEERDFAAYLAQLDEEQAREAAVVVCGSCAAETRLEGAKAERCPFCGSSLIDTVQRRLIEPQALLPFNIDQDRALTLFRQWIKSLWFAPGALKRRAITESHWLQGVYLPYWTYDTLATTSYTGQRGEYYWVTEHYTTRENGKTVRKSRRVRKTRWYPAAGVVNNAFDDILVPASRSLEKKYADILEPWDLAQLTAYRAEFLTGFRAETYQVGLREGFTIAQEGMPPIIRTTVLGDIGGDTQRIHAIDTTYHHVTFKHLLFPVWLCSYKYRNRVYRFMVNGQTGEVTGERPWCWKKITLLVLAILALIAVAIYYIR